MLFIIPGGSCAGNGLRATVALSHMKNLVVTVHSCPLSPATSHRIHLSQIFS